jgi:glycerol kinase
LICLEKIFNAANLQLITHHQESIKTLTPNPGWVEQDPYEILNKTILCMEKAVEQLEQLGYHKSNIKGRETRRTKKNFEQNIGHLTHNLKYRLFSDWCH